MKNNRFLSIIFLQGAVLIYSLTTVISKLVSGYDFLSKEFVIFYLLDFAVLGIYAILWQQLLKRFELSIAYANKAMTLLWSLLWSVVLFHEGITFAKILGVIMVIAGTIILNSPTENMEEDTDDMKGGSI
ncbi:MULTISPECIES: transporter [unclassified Butyrivibrio]|uniref:transporter n=1 Tax=unclassified Butyrivibrio TaxID=2639466 RepID=UPI00041C2616|nr:MULTISPECIES: transporter [unclassified Butyrivibrio]